MLCFKVLLAIWMKLFPLCCRSHFYLLLFYKSNELIARCFQYVFTVFFFFLQGNMNSSPYIWANRWVPRLIPCLARINWGLCWRAVSPGAINACRLICCVCFRHMLVQKLRQLFYPSSRLSSPLDLGAGLVSSVGSVVAP